MVSGRMIAVVLFHALFATVHCAGLLARARMKTKGWVDLFQAPTMLIISSPMERKVSYAQLKNGKAVGGTILPILDAGLTAPYGIAYDSKHSALYICDGAQKKIFRVQLKAFKCERQCKGLTYQLKIVGNICTVVENVLSQWAAVDSDGNLFYTDQEANAVSKLPVKTIKLLVAEEILAKDLKVTTEPEAEGEESAKESMEETGDVSLVSEDTGEETASTTKKQTTLTTTAKPNIIYQLYQKGVSKNVDTPAGVAAAGGELYWTNQVGGFSAGSVVEGRTAPRVKLVPTTDETPKKECEEETSFLQLNRTHREEPASTETESGEETAGTETASTGEDAEAKPTFPSTVLQNCQGSTYGITVTASKIIYTDTAHYVHALSRGTGEFVSLSSSMLKPRGVVWDGDQTIYVADQEGNYISSMPVGLLKANAPSSQAVDIKSPFGLAMVFPSDPLWDSFQGVQSCAHWASRAGSFVVLLLISAVW